MAGPRTRGAFLPRMIIERNPTLAPPRGNPGLEGRFRATLLGTGTSTGVPVPGCRCATCLSTDPRDGRLRCSAYIQTPSASLLIDCGPDFRRQALRFGIRRVDHVLLTHEHADHINGLDELRVFNFRQRGSIPIHGHQRVLDDVRKRFAYCFNPFQEGGGVPQFELIRERPYEKFRVGGLTVTPLSYKHGALDVMGYKLGRDFAYMSDCSAIPPDCLKAVRGIDTLILGALRREPHPTHFNFEQALEAADQIRARRVWLIHMTHDIRHAVDGPTLPPNRFLGYDGMSLEFDLA
jgi:phosphoribosyl 1,2-cyclic phosphate phosphodiesterase